MQKANPVDMRKALQVVDALRAAGLLFVAMPVLDSDDLASLQAQADERLERIARTAGRGGDVWKK